MQQLKPAPSSWSQKPIAGILRLAGLITFHQSDSMKRKMGSLVTDSLILCEVSWSEWRVAAVCATRLSSALNSLTSGSSAMLCKVSTARKPKSASDISVWPTDFLNRHCSGLLAKSKALFKHFLQSLRYIEGVLFAPTFLPFRGKSSLPSGRCSTIVSPWSGLFSNQKSWREETTPRLI